MHRGRAGIQAAAAAVVGPFGACSAAHPEAGSASEFCNAPIPGSEQETAACKRAAQFAGTVLYANAGAALRAFEQTFPQASPQAAGISFPADACCWPHCILAPRGTRLYLVRSPFTRRSATRAWPPACPQPPRHQCRRQWTECSGSPSHAEPRHSGRRGRWSCNTARFSGRAAAGPGCR